MEIGEVTISPAYDKIDWEHQRIVSDWSTTEVRFSITGFPWEIRTLCIPCRDWPPWTESQETQVDVPLTQDNIDLLRRYRAILGIEVEKIDALQKILNLEKLSTESCCGLSPAEKKPAVS